MHKRVRFSVQKGGSDTWGRTHTRFNLVFVLEIRTASGKWCSIGSGHAPLLGVQFPSEAEAVKRIAHNITRRRGGVLPNLCSHWHTWRWSPYRREEARAA